MANAQAGRNVDILELARLTVPIRIDQGGHGSTDAKQGLTNLIVNAAGVPFKDTTYVGTLKQDTLTAARTWTLPDATGTVALTSDVDATGRVLQTAFSIYTQNTSCTTKIPLDDTIPQNTEGDELVTCAITPKSATSKLRIEVMTGPLSPAANSAAIIIAAIFRDDIANAVGATYVANNSSNIGQLQASLICEVTSGALTATTFKLRLGPSATSAKVTVNGNSGSRFLGGTMGVTMTVTEIAA